MWKKNTFKNYEFILSKFQHHFGDIDLSSITSQNIFDRINQIRWIFFTASSCSRENAVPLQRQKHLVHPVILSNERIFPITYAAARIVVKKAGDLVEIHLKPHDLRRHSASYASRSGTPLEIVSKILLRHSNLSTTQIYLGKVSDVEAIRWIDNPHA